MRKSTVFLFLALPAFVGGLAAADTLYTDRGGFYPAGTWSQQSQRYDEHVRNAMSAEDRVKLGYADNVGDERRTDLSKDTYTTIGGKTVNRLTKDELNELLKHKDGDGLTKAGAKIAGMTKAAQEKRAGGLRRWTDFFGAEENRTARQKDRRAANEGGVEGRKHRRALGLALPQATELRPPLVVVEDAARATAGAADDSVTDTTSSEPKPADDSAIAPDSTIAPSEPVVEESKPVGADEPVVDKPTATVVDTTPKGEPVAVPASSKKRGWNYKADHKRHKAGSDEAKALLATRVTPEQGVDVMKRWDEAVAERQKVAGKKLKGDFFRNSFGKVAAIMTGRKAKKAERGDTYTYDKDAYDAVLAKRALAKAVVAEAEEKSFLNRTGDYYLNPTDADGKAYEGSDKNWARGRRVGAATADALAVALAGYGIATNKLIPIDILFEKGIVSPTSMLGKILRNRFVRGGITLSMLAIFMELTGLATGKGGHYGPVTGSVRMLRDWHKNRNASSVGA